LIVAVVALSLGSIGWALLARTLAPLSGLLLLLPACGFFFLVDSRMLNNWRSQLFDLWVRKDIDFRAFSDAMSAVPRLPKDTVHSMLDTLPKAADLIVEQRISPVTRGAAAAAVLGTYACESDKIVWKTVAAAIVTGSLVVAAGCRTWRPLFACFSLVFLLPLGWWLRRRRIKELKDGTFAARAKPGFSDESYEKVVQSLPFHPIQ